MKIVLQKLIASSGICSRRHAQELVAGGNVMLNGKRAKLGDRAEESDDVLVNGEPLTFTNKKIYIKLHKPVGYVCTTRSFPGEQNILELVKVRKNLTIVGRLDKESEGLVLLTDDGELAYKLTHPKFKIEKVYVVTLLHDLGVSGKDFKNKVKELTEKFLKGIEIGQGDGVVRAERFKHLRGRTFEIVLQEGKKRQIRRMFRRVGCHVSRLSRVRIGRVTIGGIKKGEWKYLSPDEVTKLKSL